MRILIAEDERITRTTLVRQLGRWGHDVTATEDGTLVLRGGLYPTAAETIPASATWTEVDDALLAAAAVLTPVTGSAVWVEADDLVSVAAASGAAGPSAPGTSAATSGGPTHTTGEVAWARRTYTSDRPSSTTRTEAH